MSTFGIVHYEDEQGEIGSGIVCRTKADYDLEIKEGQKWVEVDPRAYRGMWGRSAGGGGMKRPTRKQLLNACDIMVRCWDRAKTRDDFAEQAGHHIEDLRDMLRSELNIVARRDRNHAAIVVERLGDQQERQACQS